MAERDVGRVVHYFDRIGVAIVELSGTVKIGARIRFDGATSEFEQDVNSMQIEHQPITEAEAGQTVGFKVKEKVREGDILWVLD